MPISETAWNLLWNVQYADSESPGCANHGQPDCLCDVDITCTADLEWNQAPRDLALIEDTDDLVGAAAEMLIRTDMAANRRTISEYDEERVSLADADPAAIEHLMVLMAEHPEYGSRRLEKLSTLCRPQIESIRALLGRKRQGRQGNVANLKRGGVHTSPHLDEAARLAQGGMPPRIIVDELARRGIRVTLDNVLQGLCRRGIKSVRTRTWRMQQRMPDVVRLRNQGMHWQAIADELGISKSAVRRAYAAHQEAAA